MGNPLFLHLTLGRGKGDGFGDPVFWVILLGFLGFVGMMALLNVYWERQRSKALEAVAEELGLAFTRKGNELLAELDGFHITSKGAKSSHAASNVLRGQTPSTEVILFDYQFTTGSGKSQKTHKQTMACFISQALALPSFSLRPKTFEHRIATLFGFQAITLQEHPEFTSRWLLRGDREMAIRELFREDVIAFFQQEKGIGVEGRDRMLLAYREDKRVKPEKLRAFLDEAYQVFALWRTDGGRS